MDITRQIKTNLFLTTVKLLRNNDIPFWLDTITLLAVMGKKMGQPLLQDKNVRLSIPGEYFSRLLALEKELGLVYRFQLIPDRSGREWITNEYCCLAVLSRWKHSQEAFKVIITPKYKVHNQYRWIDKRSCKEIGCMYYDKLDIIQIHGRSFPVPQYTTEYLQIRFGEDWKNPDLKWIASIDDTTIVTDSALDNIAFKKVINASPLERIQLHKGNYHQRMKKMLLKTIDILNEKKFKYWLDAGTLLGILRDGDLISWDYDADLGIPAESADEIMQLRLDFLPKYLIKRRKIQSPWIPGDVRVIKVKTPWEKIRQINFHVDLFCVYPVKDKYRWVDSNALKHVDRKYYDTLSTIEWEGRTINIPNHVEEYLSLRYGNWQVAKQNYDAGLHDGSIAEKGF
ncbi:MAG: LicD family protein [Candidatus Marinimicrobia bacterium]|nr:LicD family protein [Candidatus Neomarinimicrobiota bacterium]MCH7763319.1 LicD family protein [Candidatus Neomarinimicrobiota bacterium]